MVDRHRPGPRLALLGAILVYSVVSWAGPLFHDVDCHTKSPGRCSRCLVTPVASLAEAPVVGTTVLPAAGTTEREATPRQAAPRPVTQQGRAPPA